MPTGHTVTFDERALMRALYEGEPDMTVVEIAATIGVNRATVFDYARENGWVRAKRGPGPGPGSEPGNRRALLNSLWLAATRQVLALTARSGEAGPGASGGVDAQALMAAVRTVEKLIEMEDGTPSGGDGAVASALPDGFEDIDEFRAAVTRRLENLIDDEGS
jgi:hypothetical protein